MLLKILITAIKKFKILLTNTTLTIKSIKAHNFTTIHTLHAVKFCNCISMASNTFKQKSTQNLTNKLAIWWRKEEEETTCKWEKRSNRKLKSSFFYSQEFFLRFLSSWGMIHCSRGCRRKKKTFYLSSRLNFLLFPSINSSNGRVGEIVQ